jgi:hypothetical protein
MRSDSRQLVFGRDSEKGRECVEIWYFIPFRESVEQELSTEWFIGMGAE